MKTFLKKIGGFSVGPILSAALGLILVPIITRFISPEEYGKASMFALAQGLLAMILYMGMDQAYAREFVGNKHRQGELLQSAIVLPLAFSVILSALMLLLREWVSRILFDRPNETVAVCLMALMFPFMVIQHFALMRLRFQERGMAYSAFSVLLKVWTLLLSVGLLLVFERSFRSVVYAAAMAEILNGTVLYAVVLRGMRFRFFSVDRKEVVGLLRFALPLVPTTVLAWALTSIDKMMLRSLCGYTDLGLYTAASKIVLALGIVQSCFTAFWVPVAFRWHEEARPKDWYILVMRIVAALMSSMCFGVLICKDIAGWLLGDGFAQAIGIFPFLLLHPIMYTMSETTATGISLSRKTGYNIIVTVASSGTNIILNSLLIPLWGGKGAAVATGISYVVLFWTRTLISRRLWWNFPLDHYVIYTVMILLNCVAHTFFAGGIPNIISAASLFGVVATNIPAVKGGIQLLHNDENAF